MQPTVSLPAQELGTCRSWAVPLLWNTAGCRDWALLVPQTEWYGNACIFLYQELLPPCLALSGPERPT